VIARIARGRLTTAGSGRRCAPPLNRSVRPHGQFIDNQVHLKKKSGKEKPPGDADTMREEFDFSRGVRGATVARYRQGSNVIVVDPDLPDLPDLVDVFPGGESVNEALRALALVIRARQGTHLLEAVFCRSRLSPTPGIGIGTDFADNPGVRFAIILNIRERGRRPSASLNSKSRSLRLSSTRIV
jgi:hypothetical protein